MSAFAALGIAFATRAAIGAAVSGIGGAVQRLALRVHTVARAVAGALAVTSALAAVATASTASTTTARAAVARSGAIGDAVTRAVAGFATIFAIGRACRRCGSGHGCRAGAKQGAHPAKKALRCSCSRCCRLGRSAGRWGNHRLDWLGLGRCHRRRRIGQHALDHRRLAVGRLLGAAGHGAGVLHIVGHLVAGFDVVQAGIVVLEAFEAVVGCFQGLVGNHQHVDALLEFDLGDFSALLIEQERGNIHRHLAQDRCGVVLEGLFLDDAQDLQGAGLGVANVARAAAARARDGGTFGECRAQALAAHLHQAELADGAKLHAGTVLAQGVAQAVFHFAAVTAFFHVDEVDHDQATEVAQTHLAGHFVGGFQVGAGRGFLNVATLDGACRVDVHRDQGFGVVNHDGAAAGQLHGAGVGGFDLVLDLEAAEQRGVVAVALDPCSLLGHDVGHELLGLFVDVVGVDQDVADVGVEIVADGTDDQARFLVNQEGTLATLGGAVNGVPELEQVVQVPLQFGRAAANAGGARNDGHAVGVLELVECFLQVGPVVAFDAARHAAAARVVGHQHDVAAGQRDERGEGGALVAALFLFHLHQQFLAFADGILDAGAAGGNAGLEKLAGNFLERQEAVALFAVVHEAGFERGLDAGDNRLVNIALALFAPFYFDFVVEQFLSVDNGQPALFRLRGVDQHPFHGLHPSSVSTCP